MALLLGLLIVIISLLAASVDNEWTTRSIHLFGLGCTCKSRLSVRTCAVIIPVLLRCLYARCIYHGIRGFRMTRVPVYQERADTAACLLGVPRGVGWHRG